MARRRIDNIVIEGAEIIWKNFSGAETPYNRKGNRNFSVVIDDEALAQKLADDGWNIKILRPRDEDEAVRHHIPVKVSYDNVPPKIVMVAGRQTTILDEESVGALDYARFVNCDIIISPYQWELPDGRSGVTAYVKSMYVTIEQDPFEAKYAFGDEDDSPFAG